jgi:hypothetical protein
LRERGAAPLPPPPGAPPPKNVEALSPAAETALADLVVFLALARVAEHVVGVGHGLEAVARAGFGVDIGVELAGELPVCLFDLFRRRALVDAEYFVVVSHS